MLVGLAITSGILAYFSFRHITHEGHRRLLILAIAGELILTTGAGSYAYITAQHRESSLKSQAGDDQSAIWLAESQQEESRRHRKLQQAFSDLDDALGRFASGAPPRLEIRPTETNSDSPAVADARSRRDATMRELVSLDGPWPAARRVLIIGACILALLLLAYWPAQWSRAGFVREAELPPVPAREQAADDLTEIQTRMEAGGGYRLGSGSIDTAKLSVFFGLLVAAATIGYLLLGIPYLAPWPNLTQNVEIQSAATPPKTRPTPVKLRSAVSLPADEKFDCTGAYSNVTAQEDMSGLFVKIPKSGKITWIYYEGGGSRGDVKVIKRSVGRISATVSYVIYPDEPPSLIELKCKGGKLSVSGGNVGNPTLNKITADEAAGLDQQMSI